MGLTKLFFISIAVAPSAKSSATEKIVNGKKSARRSSMATDVTQDTDLELFDYDTSDSIEEEDDEDDDTTDMSAIPADPGSHNHNESLGSKDGYTPFGDDYGDNYDLISDTEEEGEVGRKGERRRSDSSSAKTNRRVSFGMGTKEQMDEDEVEEGGSEMENVESDLNMSVSVRSSSGLGRGSSIGISPNVRDRSNNSVSGTSMTPRSTSSSSSSSSSSRKGKYSMGETPGSHEFTRWVCHHSSTSKNILSARSLGNDEATNSCISLFPEHSY